MSEFRKKRDSLETFLREQIIGPGAFNKKYFLTEKWDENVFKGKDLKSEDNRGLDDLSEVITEVPAYQYSSAILFPETRVKNADIDKDKNDDTKFPQDPDDEIENSGIDDEDIKEASEGLVSKLQNYPNTIGLSFVIQRETDLLKELNVAFKFRKYSKLKTKECLSDKLGCFVSEYDLEIENEVNNYFQPLFTTIRKDKNLFIVVTKNQFHRSVFIG